jgi:hypothetical protein
MDLIENSFPSFNIPGMFCTVAGLLGSDIDGVINVWSDNEEELGFKSGTRLLLLVERIDFSKMIGTGNPYIVEIKGIGFRRVLSRTSSETVTLKSILPNEKKNGPTFKLNVDNILNLYQVKVKLEYF